MHRKHLFSLSITLIIVMLFSALGPTTVYADDGAPTDTSTTEVSDSGDGGAGDQAADEQSDEATGDEGTVDQTADSGGDTTDEGVPEEDSTDAGNDQAAATEEGTVDETSGVSVADEAPASEEGTSEQPADETSDAGADVTTAEEPSLMEQVPDDTEIVVVNAEGEAEPLATQQAADAVAESDPIWCPAGQSPTPGANGCTGSFTSFDALLTELSTNSAYQGAGTIYVEMGTYSTGETSIDFNNYNLSTISNSDLTIQGGWNTSTGTTTDNTTFDVPIVIGSAANRWGGSLTLRNIIVSGVVNDTGLTVYSSGNVTVEDSEFTNNDVAGVKIDATGNVAVRRTKVNDNGSNDWNVVDGDGLGIISGGFVTLSDVEANDNQLSGADIVAANDVAIQNSFFNGNLMYTTNYADFFGYGLKVVSQGDIAISAIEANENFLWGAGLDGAKVSIVDSVFNRNVTDSVSFIDDTGLVIVSADSVDLLNVEANENRMMGAVIFANGLVSIRNSSFDNNFGTTVDANTGDDIYWGCGLQVSGVPAGSDIIGNTVDYQNCNPKNLAAGSIVLTAVTANGNYLYGADLSADGDVTIGNSSFSGNATPGEQANAQGGLMIQSGAYVDLDTVTANDNRMFGTTIVANNSITVTDSIFSNNLNGPGLSATSTAGSITLTNVNALGNAGDGAFVDTSCVYLDGGAYTGNSGYGLNVAKGFVDQTVAPTYAGNGLGDTNPNPFNPCQGGGVIITSPTPLYTVTPLTEGQLPAPLNQGNVFASALQVSGQVTSGITLSFPIPAGMENANLSVIFWNGTDWVAVSGGSVVGNEFVITVTQPGVYVLVSQST